MSILDDKKNKDEEEKIPPHTSFIVGSLLHEYDCLWQYYMKLLDERHTIYNNYILIIGAPLAAVGFVIGTIGNAADDYSAIMHSPLRPVLSFILGTLAVVGFLFYLSYAFETINAVDYYQRIVLIKKELAAIIKDVDDKIGENSIKDIYGIGASDTRTTVFDWTRTIKASILPVINTAIFIGAYILYYNYSTCSLVLGGIVLVAQLGIYRLLQQRSDKKG